MLYHDVNFLTLFRRETVSFSMNARAACNHAASTFYGLRCCTRHHRTDPANQVSRHRSRRAWVNRPARNSSGFQRSFSQNVTFPKNHLYKSKPRFTKGLTAAKTPSFRRKLTRGERKHFEFRGEGGEEYFVLELVRFTLQRRHS